MDYHHFSGFQLSFGSIHFATGCQTWWLRKSAAIKAAGCFSVGFGPKFGKNGFSQRQLLSECGLLYDYSI
jgi:hypothetical protein